MGSVQYSEVQTNGNRVAIICDFEIQTIFICSTIAHDFIDLKSIWWKWLLGNYVSYSWNLVKKDLNVCFR